MTNPRSQTAVLPRSAIHSADWTRTLPARILLIVAATLIVAAAARVSVPLWFTPVPLTLQPLAVLLVGLALGPLDGALCGDARIPRRRRNRPARLQPATDSEVSPRLHRPRRAVFCSPTRMVAAAEPAASRRIFARRTPAYLAAARRLLRLPASRCSS